MATYRHSRKFAPPISWAIPRNYRPWRLTAGTCPHGGGWFRWFSLQKIGDGCRFQPLIFQGVVWKTIHFQVRGVSFRCVFMLHNKPMLFPNVFFCVCVCVFSRGLQGDYQDFFNQPVGLFLELLPKKNLQNGEAANATLQQKIIKFPYPKTKQEVWDGSWAVVTMYISYIYIYMVDKKQMVGVFLPWKKNMYLFFGVDISRLSEVFQSEKKWVTWSVTKMNGFFRSSSMKGIIQHAHAHTIYVYVNMHGCAGCLSIQYP